MTGVQTFALPICTLADGTPLPKIKKGASAELVVHGADLLEVRQRGVLIGERYSLFLPRGTRLWARVKEDDLAENLRPFRIEMKAYRGVPKWVVAFDLQEDLTMTLRVAVGAVLADCKCRIPALGFEAKSVHEAYTRLSTAFEPSRRYHTGNVFTCVFVASKDGLRPMAEARLAR